MISLNTLVKIKCVPCLPLYVSLYPLYMFENDSDAGIKIAYQDARLY